MSNGVEKAFNDYLVNANNDKRPAIVCHGGHMNLKWIYRQNYRGEHKDSFLTNLAQLALDHEIKNYSEAISREDLVRIAKGRANAEEEVD